MATKRYYATGDFRYGTRMLRAGDPVDMSGPSARLFTALKKITDRKPRAPRAAPAETAEAPALAAEPAAEQPKPAPKKKAARKRKAKK